jgi:hypothetical protein
VIEPLTLNVKPDGRTGEKEKLTVGCDPLLSTTVGAAIEAAESCVKVKEV